jgi:hypothetical protein
MRYLKILLSLTLFLSFFIQSKAQNPGQGVNGNIDDVVIANEHLVGQKIKLSNGTTTSVKYNVDMSRSSVVGESNTWHPVDMKVGLGYKDGNTYKFFDNTYTFTTGNFQMYTATCTRLLTAVVDHSKLPVGSKIYILYENHRPNVPESGWRIEAYALSGTVVAYDIYTANPNPDPNPDPDLGDPVIGVPPAFTTPAVGSVPLYEYVSGNKRRLTTVYYSSYPGFTYTGIFGYVFTTAETGTVPLYRYTHPTNGNYYYTITLTSTSGYNYDGIACYVYGSEVTNAYPVYENYSSSLGSFHRYSTSPDIFPNYSFGGAKFYILQHSNPAPILLPAPIYVYHDGPATDHYFTSENRPAIGNGSFVNEGIAFYAFSKPGPGVVPIYVYYNQAGSDQYFTP